MKVALIIPLMIFLTAAVQRPTSPDSRPVILAYGDSLTAGFGTPAASTYPEQLQRKLDDLGYRYRVIGMGISGDTTSGGLARLKPAVQTKPSIVILELGANDGLRGLPVPQMKSNLEEMVNAFRKTGATVVMAGMTLPRNYGSAYVTSFENAFKDLASKYQLPLIPFFLEGVAGKPQLTLPDFLHPNAAGYKIVVDIVMKTLQPLLKK
jgi:acyl-CoA thioesterase I